MVYELMVSDVRDLVRPIAVLIIDDHFGIGSCQTRQHRFLAVVLWSGRCFLHRRGVRCGPSVCLLKFPSNLIWLTRPPSQASVYQGNQSLDSILHYPMYNALVDAFTIPGALNMSAMTDMIAREYTQHVRSSEPEAVARAVAYLVTTPCKVTNGQTVLAKGKELFKIEASYHEWSSPIFSNYM